MKEEENDTKFLRNMPLIMFRSLCFTWRDWSGSIVAVRAVKIEFPLSLSLKSVSYSMLLLVYCSSCFRIGRMVWAFEILCSIELSSCSFYVFSISLL